MKKHFVPLQVVFILYHFKEWVSNKSYRPFWHYWIRLSEENLMLTARFWVQNSKGIEFLLAKNWVFVPSVLSWANLTWLPHIYPTALSLPFLSRAGRKSKKKMLVSQDIDDEITDQLTSQAKQTQVGENWFNLLPIKIELDGEKQR